EATTCAPPPSSCATPSSDRPDPVEVASIRRRTARRMIPASTCSPRGEPMTALTGVHHLALTVADADRSAAFYSELLGLDEAFQIDDDTVYARVFGGDGFLF